MVAYLIQLLLIVLVYGFLQNKRLSFGIRHRHKSTDVNSSISLAIIGAFFIIIGMQAFRAPTVGTDVPGYLDLFHKVQNVNNVSSLKYNRYGEGFARLTKAISLITSSDRGYLIITTLLIQIPIAIIIHKYSRNELMSIFLYICLGFYMATFCTLRQWLAYSMCFLSYYGIKERKLIAFIIPVACAVMLHISAIVFVPTYWIYKIETRRKTIIIYLVALVVAFTLRIQIVRIFLTRFDAFFYYYSIEETGAYTWSILCIIVYVLAALLKRQQNEYRKGNSIGTPICEIDGGLLTIYGVGTVLSVGSSVATNARRITDYFTLFMILIIPEMYESIENNKNKKAMFWGIVLFGMAFYIFTLARNGGYGIIPFSFGG